MERRGFEGPMDWEYQNQPPVDPSSPFANTSHKRSFYDPPTRTNGNNMNSFAVGAGQRSSPFKQNTPQPPRSFFNPQMVNKPPAPQFRNPAFTTPQKRVDELAFSELSGAESSPAMTDTSEIPPETPDVDADDDFGKMTVTPHTAGKALFSNGMMRSRTPGRGEVPRGNRDKVRKRRRQAGDRDVGSVRPRLPHGSDESDSDWEDGSKLQGGRRSGTKRGWFGGFLAALSENPSAPAILSKWLQLVINLVLTGLVIFGMFAIFLQVRSDLTNANEKARAELVQQMDLCREHYIKNQCFPAHKRVPALEGACNEWDACMNQDPSSIMKVQVTVRNMGNVLNEFTDSVTLKTWAFILSLVLVAVVSTNIGFGFLRESLPQPGRPAEPSQPAGFPMLGAAHHNPHQAYIFAPLGETPRRVRRNFLADDATDTENSPDVKTIMLPQTPSAKRSTSKGERGRSPTKASRSPSKVY